MAIAVAISPTLTSAPASSATPAAVSTATPAKHNLNTTAQSCLSIYYCVCMSKVKTNAHMLSCMNVPGACTCTKGGVRTHHVQRTLYFSPSSNRRHQWSF